MNDSWFENLILLIAGILGCPVYETLGAFPVEPIRVEAVGELSGGASRGRRSAVPVLARQRLRACARQ